ncbi:MAG: hypothetical protein ACK5AK_11045 [Gemmatimonas sp.]
MSAAPSPSPRSSRVRNAAVVVALAAVGLAARSADQPAQAAPPQPPVAVPMAPAPVAADSAAPKDSAVADSLAAPDSLALMATDSTQADSAAAVEATPATPAAWPVDPVTGQTLINGRPVVGRVFIMQKTDGTVKYPNVADVIAHEALEPLPAVVGTSHTPAPLTHSRRMRGIMIQSTLWDLDTKRSAVERRYYRVSTPAPSNGQ